MHVDNAQHHDREKKRGRIKCFSCALPPLFMSWLPSRHSSHAMLCSTYTINKEDCRIPKKRQNAWSHLGYCPYGLAGYVHLPATRACGLCWVYGPHQVYWRSSLWTGLNLIAGWARDIDPTFLSLSPSFFYFFSPCLQEIKVEDATGVEERTQSHLLSLSFILMTFSTITDHQFHQSKKMKFLILVVPVFPFFQPLMLLPLMPVSWLDSTAPLWPFLTKSISTN